MKAVWDRTLEDEETEWVDNVRVRKLMTLGQIKAAARKSELCERKRLYNVRQTHGTNHQQVNASVSAGVLVGALLRLW